MFMSEKLDEYLKYFLPIAFLLGVGVGVLLNTITSVSASQFGCQSEECIYNSSIANWTCHYSGCPNMLNSTIVHIQNVTYNITVNTTTANFSYEIKNCTLDEITQAFAIHLNSSSMYQNCLESKDSCIKTLDECNTEKSDCVPSSVVNSSYISIGSLYNNYISKMEYEDMEAMGWYRTGATAFIVFATIWFFKLRKPMVEKTSVQRPEGSTPYDEKGLEADKKIARLESKIDEMSRSNRNVVIPTTGDTGAGMTRSKIVTKEVLDSVRKKKGGKKMSALEIDDEEETAETNDDTGVDDW